MKRLRYRLSVELQRVWCASCQRFGRYAFHWHRGHRVSAA